jgi:hypothetical protein
MDELVEVEAKLKENPEDVEEADRLVNRHPSGVSTAKLKLQVLYMRHLSVGIFFGCFSLNFTIMYGNMYLDVLSTISIRLSI